MPGRTPVARGPGLGFEFFGGPLLWRDGERVSVSPAQAGLLSVAFGDGRSRVPRALVQRLLWNERDSRAVRHRASQLFYQTNLRCGARVLETEGEHVRIRRDIVACDLDEFADLVANRRFGVACTLLERGFLDAFPRHWINALADWIEERRLNVRTRLRSACMAGWHAAEAAQDWEGAGEAAQALLRIDPGDEALLRRVMRARALGGRVREAEAVYRAFADRAGSEPGWSPAPETRKLLRSVQGDAVITEAPKNAGRGNKATKAADAPGSGGLGAGARGESGLPLRRRSDALSRANRGLYGESGGLVAVSGEEGIGKTRLVETVMRSAGFHGMRPVWATSRKAERRVPLSALVRGLNQPWARRHVRQVRFPWRSLLAILLPGADGSDGRPASALADASSLLRSPLASQVREAFHRLFAAMARTRPTVFFLDDFHWADEDSAEVLHVLCESSRDLPFRLLVAYRPEELTPGAATARLVREIEADSRSTAIQLPRLNEDDARDVAVAANPALFETASERDGVRSANRRLESTLNEVVRLAGGNPRFLAALARQGTTGPPDGRNVDRVGMADPDRAIRLRTPPSIRRLVRRRIDQLGPMARKVAVGMAVYGRPAGLEETARLAACSQGECVDALERLQELGVIDWNGGQASFRHAIVGQAMYEEASRPRRAFAHRVAANLLRSCPQGAPLAHVAHHYHLAGEREEARKYALTAEAEVRPADTALRLRLLGVAREASDGPERCEATARLAVAHWDALQLRDALRAGEQALACSDDLPVGRAGGLKLVVAEARRRLGLVAPQAALATLGTLEAEARSDRNELLLVRVLDARLAVLSGLEDVAGAGELLRKAARAIADLRDPRARCRGLALLAAGKALGLPGKGLQAGRDAWALAESGRLHSEQMIAAARCVEAMADAALLGTEEGRAAVGNARAAATGSGDLQARAAFLLDLAEWHAGVGNRRASDSLLAEVRDLAAAPAFCPPVQVRTSLVEATVALDRGDLPAAAQAIAHAREVGGNSIARREERALAGLEGEVFIQSGKLRQATEVADRHPLESALHAPLRLSLFHARLQVRAGRASDALAQLGRGLQDLDQHRNLPWLRIALETVRLARRTGSPQRDLARKARDRALELDLAELAQEFGPFTR